MKYPVIFNHDRTPRWIPRRLPSGPDPSRLLAPDSCAGPFETYVAAIKVGNTWKTTSRQRHVITDGIIEGIASEMGCPSIIEVGASCGATSLDLLDRLKGNHGPYYVTDLSFSLWCMVRGNTTYFYHPVSGECVMCASDWFLVYDDTAGAVFPLGHLAHRVIAGAPRLDPEQSVAACVLHPELRQRADADPRIRVEEYNILTAWPHEAADIVKVANVLNPVYFSEDDIRRALVNLSQALKPGGKLVLTDNRPLEKVSVLVKTGGGLVLETSVNGGSDSAEIAQRL